MAVSSDSPITAAAPRARDAPAVRPAPPPPQIVATDGELLALFTRQGDSGALDRLVDRHSAMVWRVCRATLRRPQDVEDAFQATFLLLIKNARSISSSDSAAGWLYRVAYRTSLRARKKLASRREEALAIDPLAPSEAAFPDLLQKQTTGVLVEELMRLPAKYQTPLVLRYLEGQSRRAIADQTDTTIAGVQGRLARGKQLLRRRLLRRGVSLAAVMGALGLGARGAAAAENAPARIVVETTSNSAALATGGSVAASAGVLSLYQEGVRAMLAIWIGKPLGSAAALAAAALLLMPPGEAGEAREGAPVVASTGLRLNVDMAPTATANALEPGVVELAQATPDSALDSTLLQADRIELQSRDNQFVQLRAEGDVTVTTPKAQATAVFVPGEPVPPANDGERLARLYGLRKQLKEQEQLLMERGLLADSPLSAELKRMLGVTNSVIEKWEERRSAEDLAVLRKELEMLVPKTSRRRESSEGASASTPPTGVGGSPTDQPARNPIDDLERTINAASSAEVLMRALTKSAHEYQRQTCERLVNPVRGSDGVATAWSELQKRVVDEPIYQALLKRALDEREKARRLKTNAEKLLAEQMVQADRSADELLKLAKVTERVGKLSHLAEPLDYEGLDKQFALQWWYRVRQTANVELSKSDFPFKDEERGHLRTGSGGPANLRRIQDDALRKYQAAKGLDPNGELNEATWNELFGLASRRRESSESASVSTPPTGVGGSPKAKEPPKEFGYAPAPSHIRSRLREMLSHVQGVKVEVGDEQQGQLHASIAVPSTYIEAVHRTNHPEETIDVAGLIKTQDVVVAQIEEISMPLLPRLSLGENDYKQVHVTVYTALEEKKADSSGKMQVKTGEPAELSIHTPGKSRSLRTRYEPARAARELAASRPNASAAKPQPFGIRLRPPVSDGPAVIYAQRNSEYGYSVNQLQERLNELLDPSPQLRSDGDYGPLTTEAVKRFQKLKGLPETGFANEATREELGFVKPDEDLSTGGSGKLQSIKSDKKPSEAKRTARPKWPVIEKTVPERGATDVDTGLTEVRVTFDRDMNTDGYSWTGSAEFYLPEVPVGMKPRWVDNRTCVLPVALKKGKFYRVGINAKDRDFQKFKSADGVPAAHDALAFSTKGAKRSVARRARTPKVVMMTPASGDTSVSPGVTKLRVTFDMKMGGGMSWTNTDAGPFPDTGAGRATWSRDGRTCTLPVKLAPGKAYAVGLNASHAVNFQSEYGVPLPPVVWKFTTGEGLAVDDGASRRRESSVELLVETPPTGVGRSPTDEPEPEGLLTATRAPGRVDLTDGGAEGKKSLGGSGHLIKFELPERVVGVKSVRLHGSRYGTKTAPREDFEISFLSEDRSEILDVRRGAYGLFRRGAEKWTNVRFKDPVLDLPKTFWVAIDFDPGRTKGVYLSYDTSTGGDRSMTGLAQQEPSEHKRVGFGGDWMVSVVLERADAATLSLYGEAARLVAQKSNRGTRTHEGAGLVLLPNTDDENTVYGDQGREYGWSVSQLQARLNEVVYPSPGLDKDDDYGPLTKSAVELFQRAVGLPGTGFAGEATREALGFVEPDARSTYAE